MKRNRDSAPWFWAAAGLGIAVLSLTSPAICGPPSSAENELPAPAPGSPLGSAPAPPPRSAPGDLNDRKLRYLELAYAQTLRLERAIGTLGPVRDATGALAAAALIATGRPTGGDAARWLLRSLETCKGRWHEGDCPRAQIPLQRMLLQYQGFLPGPLRRRLREEVAAVAPPPPVEQIQSPWSFKETENQRVVEMARSLVGHVVAGSQGSPDALRWNAVAEAFLKEHDRWGWYEADSPGYLAISINGLLHLADHAPRRRLRDLATRQLHLLFASWAELQVGGFPAGAKSRAYIHWAVGTINTPWKAWAWLAAGVGDPAAIGFYDWPELATAPRYRIPSPVSALLAGRRMQEPYEVRVRRRILPANRRNLDAALYSYATPDYVLSASQAIGGLQLGVSGGQEILAALYAEGAEFAPIYLWSRVDTARSRRWKTWSGDDLAVARRNLLAARLGALAGGGHVYLSPPWEEPIVRRDVALTRYGDTYVALVAKGGWEVAPAGEKYPRLYKDQKLEGARVLVPRESAPASVGVEVGRRSEDGGFEKWTKKTAKARLRIGDGGEIRFRASDGSRLDFLPGVRASFNGAPIEVEGYPLLDAPFLSSRGDGRWSFRFGGKGYEISPIP